LTRLRIGCLAWGSLWWDPRSLPVGGAFRDDGPRLPIEFSRVSLDGRVTLVIDSNAPLLTTYWVPLSVETPETAIEGLGVREKVEPAHWSRWIGFEGQNLEMGQSGDCPSGIRESIRGWLEGASLDAVVWTALPSRGPEGETDVPDVDRLLEHLASLPEAARVRAEEYIRRAPPSIRTPNRARFEEILGWFPTDGSMTGDDWRW
jgi:hypothetical protein